MVYVKHIDLNFRVVIWNISLALSEVNRRKIAKLIIFLNFICYCHRNSGARVIILLIMIEVLLLWTMVTVFFFYLFIQLTGNECHPELSTHVRAERGEIDEVYEWPGLDGFAIGVQRSLHVAGKHRRGNQGDGQRHYDVSGLREEQYPAENNEKQNVYFMYNIYNDVVSNV